MNNWIVIALLAGAAAAVLNASALSGSPMGLMLASLASFPLFVAGLGWGMPTVLLAAGVVALGYVAMFGMHGVMAAASLAIAPIVVTRLALQNRPAATTPSSEGEVAEGDVEWYPEGRLVVWIAVVAGCMVSAIVLFNSGGEGGFDGTMSKRLAPLFDAMAKQPDAPPAEQLAQLKNWTVAALPSGMGIVALVTMVISLAIAIALVKRSGVSLRPWAKFSQLRFPRWALWALSGAAIATLLSDPIATFGEVFAGTLFAAYVILGIAVIHALTSQNPMQGFFLTALYVAVLMPFLWPITVPALILLAMLDQAFNLRSRMNAAPPST